MIHYVTAELRFSEDPASRIQMIEKVAEAICEAVNQDPADCMMMLLTAAAHIAIRFADKPPELVATVLAESLGGAILAAKGFFPPVKTGP